MRIIVDADAIPSLNELEANIHYINEEFKSVDIAISDFINKNDILITQDYGFACITLSKKAPGINPKRDIYSNNNIDNLLEINVSTNP